MLAYELQRWAEKHWPGFRDLHRDAEVMEDLGGPVGDEASREKFERYSRCWDVHGISRWAVVERESGRFLGYAGVMRRDDADHPLGVHHEIGWRLCRDWWRRGVATASARDALSLAWTTSDAWEILSYTAVDNIRSQRVMQRLGLRRDATRDFTARYPAGRWSGLVWVADRPAAK